MLLLSHLRYFVLIVVIVFLPLAGWTTLLYPMESLSPMESFNQVATTVDARLRKEISWDASQYDDAFVRSTIDKLLSRPLTPETAVEVALKLAVQHFSNTGRSEKREIVALEHGYHGDTAGAMSVSDDSPFTDPFRSLR